MVIKKMSKLSPKPFEPIDIVGQVNSPVQVLDDTKHKLVPHPLKGDI